jgi:hypothetical protein
MPVAEIVRLPADDREAIATTLRNWQEKYPQMGILALLPENEKPALADIQALFRELEIPLAGAIFPALIDGARFHSDGVLFFCFESMPPYLLIPELNQQEADLESVCQHIAGQLSPLLENTSPDTSLFMVFDAMVPQIGQILENLYMELADRVHYMGVNAGSETFEPLPCLFDHQQIIGDGMLALLLDEHEGAILEHGYQVPEHMVAATSTEGNRIISIDWRPAFEVYTEIVKQQFNVDITAENFYEYAVHFPFGIIRADSEILVRIPVALCDDGSLFCVGEIPPNAVLTLLDAPKPDSDETVEKLLRGLASKNNEKSTVLFYCAGRRLHLGLEAAENELNKLLVAKRSDNLYGALSLGEIGSSHRGGYPLFHNATLVATEL